MHGLLQLLHHSSLFDVNYFFSINLVADGDVIQEALVVPAANIVRNINQLLLVRRSQVIAPPFPPTKEMHNGRAYCVAFRGAGLPDEHRPFYEALVGMSVRCIRLHIGHTNGLNVTL